MIKYVYVVHSKLNEDFVRDEFDTAEDAIAYAEENQDQGTSVEQVEVDVNDFGEVTDVGDSEIIWDVPEVEDALISDDEYPEFTEEELELSEDDLAELDADYADVSEEELAALEAEHEDEVYAEADQMDTLEDQAMAEAEHPIDEAVSTKKNYHARLDELEAKLEAMDEDVCKDYKVITHSEDEVKDLKESLLHEGVSAEAVAVVSELLEDEWEAISGYEDAAAKLEKLDVEDKEKVLHVLDHISEEESIHVGQLEQIVKLLNPEHIAKQDEGHEEGAEELAGEDPHQDDVDTEDTEYEEVDSDEDLEVEEELDYDKLREELEEHEDEVECQKCFNLVSKDDCVKQGNGYVCKECLMHEEYNPLLDDTLFADIDIKESEE